LTLEKINLRKLMQMKSNDAIDFNCPICFHLMSFLKNGMILNKYIVKYWICKNCQFVCTENPFWLIEAYAEPQIGLDVGAANRSLLASFEIKEILKLLKLNRNEKFVDWASGSGLLVRLLRDRGFDFSWQDKYAANIFAVGFEFDEIKHSVEVSAVTAIEVLEHVQDPIAFFKEVIQKTGSSNIIFSQVVFENSPDPDWWYFVTESGQHISFYSIKTLRAIGKVLNLELWKLNNLYVFSKEQPNKLYLIRSRIALKCIGKAIQLLITKHSLAEKDFLGLVHPPTHKL